MTGKDYVAAVLAKYNFLFAKAGACRSIKTDKLCSRGCNASETLNHMIQQFFATHRLKIQRQDDINNCPIRSQEPKGYTVHKEKVYTSPSHNKLKPDIVAHSVDQAIVIDDQVVNDQFSFKEGFSNKLNKYTPLMEQLAPLRSYGVPFDFLIFNWRGTISLQSSKFLPGYQSCRKMN